MCYLITYLRLLHHTALSTTTLRCEAIVARPVPAVSMEPTYPFTLSVAEFEFEALDTNSNDLAKHILESLVAKALPHADQHHMCQQRLPDLKFRLGTACSGTDGPWPQPNCILYTMYSLVYYCNTVSC